MAQARPSPCKIFFVAPPPPPQLLDYHPVVASSAAPPPPLFPSSPFNHAQPPPRPQLVFIGRAPPRTPGPPPPPHAFMRAATIAEVEEAKMQTLLQFMKNEGILPTPEDEQKRKDVILQLKKIVSAWIKTVALQKGLKDLSTHASAAVWTFGSYGLGVHSCESDIDAICVAPYFATLEDDFFGVLHRMLSNRPEVSQVQCVKCAKVPLMRFKFNGVAIDFPFARLSVTSVPDDVEGFDIESFLCGIDETSLKSLSGVRANRCILQLVPNLQVFQHALRCIKLWAKRRGVYSHTHGFLGGIHLAILTAWVCQQSPEASVTAIISLFFATFSNWPWNQYPVSLRGQCKHPGRSFMHIEMPCSPYEWCNSNISRSTFTKIMVELCRGNERTAGHCLNIGWLNIFDPYPYAARHKYFMRIFLSAPTSDELHDWLGWVKSRFCSLLRKIEEVKVFCDPNPTEDTDHVVPEPNRVYYWGLSQWLGRIVVSRIMEDFRRCIDHDTHGPGGDPQCKLELSIIDSSQLPKNMQLDPAPGNRSYARCDAMDCYNVPGFPIPPAHPAFYWAGYPKGCPGLVG